MVNEHKYRVRKTLFGNKSVLQKLVPVADHWYDPSCSYTLKWVDVEYDEAPRALTTEIKD